MAATFAHHEVRPSW